MSEPNKLRDEVDSDFELALLDAASLDEPSPRDRARMFAALGVGGAVGVTAAATTSAASAGAKGGLAGAFKWWLGGLVVAIGVTGGLAQMNDADLTAPASNSEVSSLAERVLADLPAALEGATSPKPAPTASAEPNESTERTATSPMAPARPLPKPRSSSPAPAASQLADEVVVLEQARRAIAEGRADDALKELKGYEESFDGGTLGPEAELLQIEALVAHGAYAQAIAAGQRFVATHANSPHVSRAQTLMAQAREAAKKKQP